MKKSLLWALLLCLLAAAGSAAAETGLEQFAVRHGNEESPRIAITMDDVWETEWVWRSAELCEKYGIHMTFFPCGVNLAEEDRDSWRRVIELGNEIGCHSYFHESFRDDTVANLQARLTRFQKKLDAVLGFHYATRWFRPPFGNITDQDGTNRSAYAAAKKAGYDHVLLWNVSNTDPTQALHVARNGCIMLFHARKADYECLEILIPQLLEAGFEPVTVSALFGLELPETGALPPEE